VPLQGSCPLSESDFLFLSTANRFFFFQILVVIPLSPKPMTTACSLLLTRFPTVVET
jgi:hypothetical protein